MSGVPALHALVVTFRRRAELMEVLGALAEQTRPPDTITVVDNNDDPDVALLVADFAAVVDVANVAYVAAGGNLGPAGGLALGVETIARTAGPADSVVFVDDDDPPPGKDTLATLMRLRRELEAAGVNVGAVGCNGARFDRRCGRLERVADDQLVGPVRVDFIGGGCYPVYSVAALLDVGGPRADMFFGFDDLELGLRLADRGYRLFASDEIWRGLRTRYDRAGLTPRQAAFGRRRSGWRRYYGARNLVWIARRHGGLRAGVTAASRAVLGALDDVGRQRRLAAAMPALRGIVDAWRGRLGRRVDPDGS